MPLSVAPLSALTGYNPDAYYGHPVQNPITKGITPDPDIDPLGEITGLPFAFDPYGVLDPDVMPNNPLATMAPQTMETPVGWAESIANALGAVSGYAPGSPGAIAHGGTPNTQGMVSAHGWGQPGVPGTLSGLTPAQSIALGLTQGYNDTMNINQAAINDAIAHGTPVSSMENPSAIGQFGYGINASVAPPNTGYTSNAVSDAVAAPAPAAAAQQAAALAEAQGYAESQASPTGYGYGLSANLGQPDNSTTSDTSDSAAPSMGYGYGLNLGAPTADQSAPDSAAPAAAVGTTGDE